VDLGAIGLFTLVGLPYTLKFLWSPLFDRYVPPFLGRRRGWMLVGQIAVAAAIAVLGLSSPAANLPVVVLLALGVTFTSASQDIVLDAYRRESLEDAELGFGTSIFVSGYRLAMLTSGALALALADRIPWRAVYFLMAAFMAVGVLTTILCREPDIEAPPPRTLRDAVVEPFLDFFRRRGAWLVLAFIVLYKVGDQMASAMTTPFVLDLGFTKTELAAVVKLFGLVSMIVGGLVGGVVMLKIGIRRSLWAFGILQAVSVLAFAALAQAGRIYGILAGAVSLENFSFGMGASAYAAYMASQTNKRFTATQFALLSSLTGIPRVLAAAPTGFLAKAFGWTGFFAFCAAAAIPGLVLLFWVAPWGKPRPEEP
jgi:PAT family beta-lactamase induction signal transducer AmpG